MRVALDGLMIHGVAGAVQNPLTCVTVSFGNIAATCFA